MAIRPVFQICVDRAPPWFQVREIDFTWHAGFSRSQARKSVESLHTQFLTQFPGRRLLEVSSASSVALGQALSAFTLQVAGDNGISGESVPLEVAYQGSKVFRHHGRLVEAYGLAPREAKRQAALRHTEDELVAFEHEGVRWPLEPTTAFYDWLYLTALAANESMSAELVEYDAFTDVKFNPAKSSSTQARSAALYVGLAIHGDLQTAMSSAEEFRRCESLQESRGKG